MHLHPIYPLQAPALNRRSFIGSSASLLAALWATRIHAASSQVQNHPVFESYPFALGVASGDPEADGFVIWTRLAPKPLEGGGMPTESVLVHWRVAEDEEMSKVVASGQEIASPDWAHSVHVEVSGLKDDRWYWYEFKAGMETSPRGRTRTLQSASTAAAKTTPLKIAVASCQHFEAGFYTAYDHMLEESPDLVLHLGDYIYEGPEREGQVRKHLGPEIRTLQDYRNRHALYKTDPSLQAMHQAAPWLVTWDDHEFDNNYAAGISEKQNYNPSRFLLRRAAAYQAYYEHMPLRRACIPRGPDMQIYRRVQHGQLVDFHVLDTRQYRTDQPNGDGRKPPGEAALNPKATLLGENQHNWLLDNLGNSNAQWNVLAQQVMMARADRKPGDEVEHSMDQWPGYEMERRSILNSFVERKVVNPIVLTGDIHSQWANELVRDFVDPEAGSVGAEFVCTSISSGGDGRPKPADYDALIAENPFVKFHNTQRGYVSCTISPETWKTDFRTVDYVTRAGAPMVTHASFVVEAGSNGLQRVGM